MPITLQQVKMGLNVITNELESIEVALYMVMFLLAVIFCIFLYILQRQALRLGASEQNQTKQQICKTALLLLYTFFMFELTVFSRDVAAAQRINLVPLQSFLNFTHINSAMVQGVCNIILFMPFGALLWHCIPKAMKLLQVTAISLCASLAIECIQLVTWRGYFDIDDLIFNVLGGMLGYLFYARCWQWARKYKWIVKSVHVVVVVCASVVFFAGAAVAVFVVVNQNGSQLTQANVSMVENTMSSGITGDENNIANADSDLLWYDGKAYAYNEDIITLLFFGIDQRSEEIEQIEGISGVSGQADCIMLMVINCEEEKFDIIAISRDTMTPILTYDYYGNYMGESINHLALAYAFGDGQETSCQYVVNAVSKLFYGMPINGYVALNMESVVTINDAVGGVTVTLPEDLSFKYEEWVEGATVTLTGEQALQYVKYRNTSVANSNNLRMIRQKEYLKNFYSTALDAMEENFSLPITLYNELSKQMITDISLEQMLYLISEVSEIDLNTNDIYALEGESVAEGVYDEFYVDDSALYQLILELFYQEVEVNESE